ncbi:DUF4347 domain-containing protein [Halomonas sp. CUBES01]|uniref:DUF4347 domain-containing protein n=1 Tax=Halomonas sp. CUBES01 TaxID=2897340 RepID=UPI001E473E4D|nr:DUF4347 domain-containing protein [Halomonas sp. CUBES01]MEC4766724.1 DUF4347 domain-containing protein [Halomonas sp. CUBES01]
MATCSSFTQHVLFIDLGVPDWQQLMAQAAPNVNVVLLDPQRDGLEQVAEALAGCHALEAIHIVAHGLPGRLYLGNAVVDAQALDDHSTQLSRMGAALSAEGSFRLYACNVAEGDEGQAYLAAWAAATGVSVAASSTPVGSSALGGNWQLDRQVGAIDTPACWKTAPLDYAHLLVMSEDFDDEPVGASGSDSISYGDFTFYNNANNNIGIIGDIDDAMITSAGDNAVYYDHDLDGGITSLGFRATDGSEFALNGFEIDGGLGDAAVIIEGKRNGTTHYTANIDLESSMSDGGASYSYTGDYYGDIAFDGWDYLDEVTFSIDGSMEFGGLDIGLDDISVGAPVVPNSPPTLTSPGEDASYTEDSGAVVVDSTFTVADDDGDTITGGTVSITGNRVDGDVLAVQEQSGITSSYDAANGVLTLSGTATPADYEAVLRTLTFNSTSDGPTDATRTLTYSLTDSGSGSAGTAVQDVKVMPVNDAPTIDDGVTYNPAGTDEDTTSSGIQVSSILADAHYADPDTGSAAGIAVTSVSANGTWQYSTDGTDWTDVGAVSDTSSLLLSSSTQVRYVPDGENAESAIFQYRAWDQTTGSASTNGSPSTADSTSRGGTTAFSENQSGVLLDVTAVNDAPTLDPGTFALNGTDEDTVSDAVTVTALLNDRNWADVDAGASLGIAVTGTTGDGTWQYSLDGTDWTDFGAVSSSESLLLDGATEVRFNPIQGGNANFSFRAWDQTTGSASLKNARSTADTTTSGGTTAFSSATASADVAVSEINEAPTLSATGSNPTYIEGAARANLFDSVTASTIEAGQSFTAMTLTVTNVADGASEVLTIDGSDIALTDGNSVTTATHGLPVTVSVAGGTATVGFTGASLTEAQLQTLVDGLSYRNTSDNPTTGASRVVTITGLTDDGGTANGGTDTASPNLQSTVSLTGVNDAPVIGNLGGDSVALEAGGAAVGIDAGQDAAVANADSADYNGGALAITDNGGNNTASGNFSVDGTQVTAGGDATIAAGETIAVGGTAIGTVHATDDGQGGNALKIQFDTADATNARVQTLLQNLEWSAAAGSGAQTFTATLSDGDGTANGGDEDATANFSLTLGNPPVVGHLEGDTVTFNEGDGRVRLDQAASATLTDADAPASLNGGNLTATVSANAAAGEDVLTLDTSGAVSLGGTSAGSNVSVGGTVVGTLGNNLAAGNDLVVNFNTNATLARVESLLQALGYANDSQDPTAAPRTIDVTVTDNDGLASAESSVLVAVVPINDAPTFTTTATDPTFTEEGAAASLFSGTVIDAIESGDNIEQLELAVSGLSDGADEQLMVDGESIALTDATAGTTKANGFGYAVSLSGTTATVTLNKSDNAANWQALVDGLGYRNASDDPDTTTRTATLTAVSDTGGTANGGSDTTTLNQASQVTVVAVNDAPVIAINDGPSVRTGNRITVTDTHLRADDPDDDGDGLTYTLDTLPASGTLSLDGTDLVVGDTFTQQDIDDGLLAFTAGGSAGDVSFEVTLADGGEDGAGTVSDTVTLSVTSPPSSPDPDPEPEPEPGPIQVTPPEPQPPTPSGVPSVRETITNTGSNPGTAKLVENTGSTNEVTATLPGGVSLINEGARTAVNPEQALADLIASIDARQPTNAGDQTGVAGQWLSRLDEGLLDVRTLVLSDSGSGSTNTPIQISGVANDDDSGAGHQEAFVIDTRSLPAGNQLQLDHIDFASVIGATTITGGGGDNVVIGDDADQFIVLGEGDDELHGGGGDDTIGSEGGDDRLFGEDGDDTLFGGAGADLLHGGRDTDTVRYEGSRDDYVIAQEYGVVTVHSKADPEDSDTLVNIETLTFADDELALSYDDDLAWITGLYDQVLGRQADVDGIQYWAKQHAEGLGKSEMARLFMTSEEAGQSLDVQDDGIGGVVDTLYASLLGRTADAPGKAYWVDQLESGASLGDVVGGFMEAEEMRTHDLGATQWDFIA